jgi:hypothetical protein
MVNITCVRHLAVNLSEGPSALSYPGALMHIRPLQRFAISLFEP